MTATAQRFDNDAQVHSIWGRPDMSILAAGRRQPPVMSGGLFGDMWPLVNDLAAGAGSSPDYVGLGMIISAASLIGGRRRVRPWQTSNWSEPCIIWGAMVGDPSQNKSPALDPFVNVLKSIERDAADQHTDAIRAHQTKAERAKAEKAQWAKAVETATKEGQKTPDLPTAAVAPDAPERRRPIVMDATPEAVGAILAGNTMGTLHLRDELAGWLESFDRYSPGGRTFWLEAYGGRPYIVDRKGQDREPLRIPFNGVSVMGGIQPDRMADALLSGADDGLVARFLWAWPNPVPFARPCSIADTARLGRVFRALESLPWGIAENGDDAPVTLSLDDAAADLYDAWRSEQCGSDEDGALYKGAVGKLSGTVLRLALVSELLAWADKGGAEPRSISVQAIGAALDYAEEYAKPMAKRVFGDAALPAVERNAAVLARYIKRNRLTKFNARDIRRQAGLPGMRDAQKIGEAIDALVEADWLRATPSRDGGTVGRQRLDYTVNPAVMEA